MNITHFSPPDAWEFINIRKELDHTLLGKCPCCRRQLVSAPVLLPKPKRLDTSAVRSKGHLHSAIHPNRVAHVWLFICQTCNSHQGNLSLWEWALVLKHREDSRQIHVGWLILWLMERDVFDFSHTFDLNPNLVPQS